MPDGRGYCPRCGRVISLDVSLFGFCEEHGRVPANFSRPAGWVHPDEKGETSESTGTVVGTPPNRRRRK